MSRNPPILSINRVIEDDCRYIKNKYRWTIGKIQNASYSFQSLEFPADASNDIPKWSLVAYKTDSSPFNTGYFTLSVISHNESTVNARFVCAILDDRKEEIETVKSPRINCTKGECFRFSNLLKRNTTFLGFTNVILPPNTLTIIFEVSVMNVIPDRSNIAQSNDTYNNLSKDLGTLLDNDQFSDVDLVTSGHELKAHKNILAARSKVFAAMFQHEMGEHNLNCVTITDVDHEVLKEMLHYMYTDKVPKLDTMAEGLLAAADKYELENLKAMCEESLRRNITIENAACTLILADRHSAKQLKSEALNFFIRNASSVKETQGFRDMATTNSHLIVEVFCAMASKQMQP